MSIAHDKKRFKLSNGKKLFLAALPFLILYFIFSYLPLEGWKYAFYDYKPGKALADCEYVGWKYFTYMFQNPVGRREAFRVLKNTFIYSGIGFGTSLLPMAFAIFLNEITGKNTKGLCRQLLRFRTLSVGFWYMRWLLPCLPWIPVLSTDCW